MGVVPSMDDKDVLLLCKNKHCQKVLKCVLEKEGFLDYLKKSVWRGISNDHVVTDDETEQCSREAFTKADLHVQMKNEVYKQLIHLSITGLPKTISFDLPPRKDYLHSIKMEWEEKLMKSLIALSSSLNMPLIRMRTDAEKEKLNKNWNSISTLQHVSDKFYPIFSSKDLLNTLKSVNNPNLIITKDRQQCNIIHSQITYKTLTHLRKQYNCLHPTQYDTIRSRLFVSAKQSCCYGCPVELRCKMWMMALGIDEPFTDIQSPHSFVNLKVLVLRDHFLIDDLIAKDIRRIAANDVEYFIFEDMMHQILMVFFRDDETLVTTALSNEQHPVYSINGVIPFHGFSMYVAPLCFLNNRTEIVYSLFKRLFNKYFHKLTIISDHGQGIVGLCELFESVMSSRLPELFHYLVKIDCHPLKLVLPWLLTAFSGIISSSQLLLLWDFIIGYDSLEILPLLAVGLLEFRAKSLFQVTSISEAESVLTNFNSLTITPILQQVLFLI